VPPPIPPPPQPSTATATAAQSPSAQQAQSNSVDDLAKKEKGDGAKDDSHGIFGPFRIGPVIGIGLPRFLSFGGAIKLTKYFGAGLNYGIIPEVQFAYYGDATVRYQGVDIYGHIHPFGGGFFLGAAVGYAHARGTYEEEFRNPLDANAPAFPYTSEATVQTLVLTPELGYFFTFKSGFTLGVEAGLQIPIAPSDIDFESRVNYPSGWSDELKQVIQTQYVEPTDARVHSTLEKVGQTILPTVGIKMGWLF
jgi:hypothetical protein